MHQQAKNTWRAKRILGILLALAWVAYAAPAEAGCATRDKADYDLGTWTSGQTAKGVAETLTAPVGIRCTGPLLSLIGSNSVVAKVHSQNAFVLVSPNGQRISYVASVTPDGKRPVAQDGEIQYGDPVLLALLGLNGRTEAELPISFAAFRGNGLRTGSYLDIIIVDWTWRVCDGVNVLGVLCVLYQQGTGRTTISLTMNVIEKSPTIVITARIVHDPIRGTNNPLAVPGASRLTHITITNPDVVPLDPDSVVLALPVDPRLKVSQTPVPGQDALYRVDRGSGSTMALSYVSADSTTDDVDFSSDAGATWTAVPPPDGSGVSAVRLRMKGILQPGESVTILVSYKIE
jgi:hypothetical protein